MEPLFPPGRDPTQLRVANSLSINDVGQAKKVMKRVVHGEEFCPGKSLGTVTGIGVSYWSTRGKADVEANRYHFFAEEFACLARCCISSSMAHFVVAFAKAAPPTPRPLVMPADKSSLDTMPVYRLSSIILPTPVPMAS